MQNQGKGQEVKEKKLFKKGNDHTKQCFDLANKMVGEAKISNESQQKLIDFRNSLGEDLKKEIEKACSSVK